MNIDFQISMSRLNQAIVAMVEKAVLPRDLGLGGIMEISFNPLDYATDDEDDPPVEESAVLDTLTVFSSEVSRGRLDGVMPVTTVVTLPPILPPVPGMPPPPSTTTVHTLDPLLVQITLQLKYARLAVLMNMPDTDIPDEHTVTYSLKVILTATPPVLTGGSLVMQVSVVRLEVGYLGFYPDQNRLPEEVRQKLEEAKAEIEEILEPLVFPVDSVAAALGAGLVVWNVGVAVSAHALTLRLQIERADLTDSLGSIATAWRLGWDTFYSRGPDNRLAGNEWALFIPNDYFHRTIEAEIINGLDGRTDVHLNGDNLPRSSFSASGGRTVRDSNCTPGGNWSMVTRFSVKFPGQCLGYDIDVNLAITTRMSMPRENVLRADVHINHAVDEGDAILCFLLATHLVSGAGFIAGATLFGWIGGIAFAAIGGLASGAMVFVGLNQGLPSLESPRLIPVEGTNNQYYTEVVLPIPSAGQLALVPVELAPCPDGVAVTGRVVFPTVTNARLNNVRKFTPIEWEWTEPHCPSNRPAVGYSPSFQAVLQVAWYRLRRTSNVPVVLYFQQILQNAPETDLTSYVEVVDGTDGIFIKLTLPQAQAQALRDRAASEGISEPGFLLLVQTNAGARVLQIPGLGPDPTDASLEELRGNIVHMCEMHWSLLESIEERAEEIQPYLVIEPGLIEEYSLSNLWEWEIAATGLEAGDELHIGRRQVGGQNGEMNLLGMGKAGNNGLLVLRYWERQPNGLSPLMAAYKRIDGGTNTRPDITLVRRNFAFLADIPVNGVYRSHTIGRVGNEMRLAVISDRGVEVYGLTNPLLPGNRSATKQSGLAAARWSFGKLLTWGDSGLFIIDSANRLRQLLNAPVSAAVEHRRTILAVGSMGVAAIDPVTGQPSVLTNEPGNGIGTYGDLLIVSNGQSQSAYDIKDPFHPAQAAVPNEWTALQERRSANIIIQGDQGLPYRFEQAAAVLANDQTGLEIYWLIQTQTNFERRNEHYHP